MPTARLLGPALPALRVALRWLNGSTTLRRFNDTRVRVPRRVAMHIPAFVRVRYEPHEWFSVEVFGRPGGSFLDVGANIGVLTLQMSRVAGAAGRVRALEPQPAVFALLVELLDRNRCRNVNPLQALLLDRVGVADLHISDATPLGVGSSVLTHDEQGAVIRVAALTIDVLYDSDETVDYIKIDAEGAERAILRGAARTLARCRPVVQVEIHGQLMPAAERPVHELFAFMDAQGYVCVNLATQREADADEFMENTHYHVTDPVTGEDLAYRGYGQVLFVPRERDDLRALALTDARLSPVSLLA